MTPTSSVQTVELSRPVPVPTEVSEAPEGLGSVRPHRSGTERKYVCSSVPEHRWFTGGKRSTRCPYCHASCRELAK